MARACSYIMVDDPDTSDDLSPRSGPESAVLGTRSLGSLSLDGRIIVAVFHEVSFPAPPQTNAARRVDLNGPLLHHTVLGP